MVVRATFAPFDLLDCKQKHTDIKLHVLHVFIMDMMSSIRSAFSVKGQLGFCALLSVPRAPLVLFVIKQSAAFTTDDGAELIPVWFLGGVVLWRIFLCTSLVRLCFRSWSLEEVLRHVCRIAERCTTTGSYVQFGKCVTYWTVEGQHLQDWR